MAKTDARLVSLVVIVVIATLVYFAYLRPSGQVQQPGENVAPSNSNANLVNLRTFTFASSSAWQIPESNVTFHHNVSIENGSRLDVFTFSTAEVLSAPPVPSTSQENFGLIIIIPKKLASNLAGNSSAVRASHDIETLREDPIGYFPRILVSATPVQRGILIPLPPELSESELAGANVIAIPIKESRARAEQLQAIAQVLDTYADVFENIHSSSEAFDVDVRLSAILNQVKKFEDRYVDLARYLDSLRNSELREDVPLQLTALPSLSAKISEIATKNSVSFDVCRLPDCSTPQRQFYNRPLVRVDGKAGEYSTISYSDIRGDLTKVKVTIGLDFSNVPLAGGQLQVRGYNREPLNRVTGSIVVAYPEHIGPGSEVSAPLTVEVNHVPDLIRVAHSIVRSGKGGELFFVVTSSPSSVQGFNVCGTNQPVELPGVSSHSVQVFYAPEEIKAQFLRQDCPLLQNDLPTGLYITTGGTARPQGLSQLYPVVADASSWRACEENFCTCDAAGEALKSAIQKTQSDAAQFYTLGYSRGLLSDRQHPFEENFLLLTTNFDATCTFAGVEFEGNAKPKPGMINLVSIRLNPDIPADFKLRATSGAGTFVADREIAAAAAGQWLCHDSNGLPVSQPNDDCSRELRSPPVITVAAIPRQ